MALIGDFSDTPFADLIQLYTSSRQTVAVTVNLPGGEAEGGIFFVENGDVVDARLGGATGRDAVREALRLSAGSFIVEPNVRAPARTVHIPWTRLLMEETVRIDEENHSGATPLPLKP
ncbi:MAG TPA: DUF4388 domain-containing protein, partial [Anaeromyxobacteraceae bacterium]|nr:DUF4388 domain-containing protein [Anaeromyxobacteraceae bacterium]